VRGYGTIARVTAATDEPDAPVDTEEAPADVETPIDEDRWGLVALRRAARLAAPAIGLYLLLRLIAMTVTVLFAVDARARHIADFQYYDGSTNTTRGWRTVMDLLLSFDGRWYTFLAAQGYGQSGVVDPSGVPQNYRLAFFPLYPMVIRIVSRGTGMPVEAAAIVVSVLASIAAAWALYAIGERLYGRRAGILLAGAWALVPEGVTEHAGFTESLFTALAAWALYAVLVRQWVVAGCLVAIAGLSRPTAVALVGTVGLAALVAVVRRRDGWEPYVAVLVSPIGYLAYLLYAGGRLGRVDGFFDLQRNSWDSYFDYGKTTGHDLFTILSAGDPQWDRAVFVVSALTVLAVVPLLVLAGMVRTPWVLLVFAAAMAVGVLGSHSHFSTLPRHLLPTFPLLIAPAVALARARTRYLVVILVFAALLAGWYGGWVPLSSGQTV
jgi:dolichyl-phosphate-mannose-protein mannosyltransferase